MEVQMPLEIRFKVLRLVAQMCKQGELEVVLVKLWRLVKQLACSDQIEFIRNTPRPRMKKTLALQDCVIQVEKEKDKNALS